MTHLKGEYKVSRQGNYIHERLEYPRVFQKGSLRTVKQGQHRIVIGRRRGRGSVSSAQSILHPKSESITRIRKHHAQEILRAYIRHRKSGGTRYMTVRQQEKKVHA